MSKINTPYTGVSYTFKGIYLKNYDGDTITATVDLGFNITHTEQTFRLWGIDTPELRGGTLETKAKAKLARDFLRDKINACDKFELQTIRGKAKGKYGRYLAIIWCDGVNMNDALVDNGLAVYKSY